jgi:hypothetical protein
MKWRLSILAACVAGCASSESSPSPTPPSASIPTVVFVEIVYDAAGDVATGTSTTSVETILTAGGDVLTGQTPAQFAALTP